MSLHSFLEDKGFEHLQSAFEEAHIRKLVNFKHLTAEEILATEPFPSLKVPLNIVQKVRTLALYELENPQKKKQQKKEKVNSSTSSSEDDDDDVGYDEEKKKPKKKYKGKMQLVKISDVEIMNLKAMIAQKEKDAETAKTHQEEINNIKQQIDQLKYQSQLQIAQNKLELLEVKHESEEKLLKERIAIAEKERIKAEKDAEKERERAEKERERANKERDEKVFSAQNICCVYPHVHHGTYASDWVLLVKSTASETFQYDSHYWTTCSLLNQYDTSNSFCDAKLEPFNSLPVSQLRIVSASGLEVILGLPRRTTLLDFFQSGSSGTLTLISGSSTPTHLVNGNNYTFYHPPWRINSKSPNGGVRIGGWYHATWAQYGVDQQGWEASAESAGVGITMTSWAPLLYCRKSFGIRSAHDNTSNGSNVSIGFRLYGRY